MSHPLDVCEGCGHQRQQHDTTSGRCADTRGSRRCECTRFRLRLGPCGGGLTHCHNCGEEYEMFQDQVTHERCFTKSRVTSTATPDLVTLTVEAETVVHRATCGALPLRDHGRCDCGAVPRARLTWVQQTEERLRRRHGCSCSAFHSEWGARFGMLFELIGMFPPRLPNRFMFLEVD